MRKTTYYLIALLICSCLWQINAQTTHNLDWYMDVSSADASLTIDAGDTVIWTFTDTAPHSVTSDTGSNETFDSGTLDDGSTYQYTFTEEGVNDYHCEVHPSMVGTITVNAVTEENQVQIGDSNDGSNTNSSPIAPYYGYSYSQVIYLASEINASGEITSVDFQLKPGSNIDTADDNVDVWIGHTTKSSFENTSDWVDVSTLTQVLNDGTITSSDDILTITFETPFSYNGIDNLIIAIDANEPDFNESTDYLLQTNTPNGENLTIYYNNDNVDNDPLDPIAASNIQARRGNVTFNGIVQTCPYPSGIAAENITAFSADLTWTEGGTETEWEILYGEAGFDPETEGISVIDDNGVLGESLTDLSSETEYEVYIKSICSASDESTYVGPFNFTTLISCPAPSEIFTTNVTPTTAEVYWLAGGTETEWELLYGETGFDPETEGMTANDNDGSLGIELTDLTPQMQYDVYVKAVCGLDDESDWVGPYTFGDYNALEVTGGFNEDVIANGIGEASTTTTNLVDNDSYAYLTVDYQSSPSVDPAGFGLPIDGNLSEGPIDGLNFQMADYSGNNALRMDTAGESNAGTLTFNNSQTANNLYIMATSGSGAAVLAGSITFADDSTQDFSGIDVPDWYGGPADMTVVLGLGRVNVTDGNATSNSSNPRIYQLEVNIDPSNYDKVISSVDLYKESGDGVISVFGASIQFAPDCPAPSAITFNNITLDSAEVTWTAGNTETEWEILYGEAGFDPETEGIMMTDDDGEIGISITDLSASTSYDVYVRAVCGEDNESIWVLESLFTLPSNDECDNAIELVLNDDLECTSTTPGATVGATASDLGEEEESVTGTPDNDVWFTFTATSASHPISLSNIEAIIGTSTDMGMALYDGTEGCEVLTLVDDSDPNSFTSTGLTVGNTYYLRVYGWGSTNTAQTTFDVCVQTIQCPTPMEVSIENITTSSAEVTWIAGGSETEWEILYGEAGFDPETEGMTVSDNDDVLGVTLSDLDMDTTYEVYVKAICSESSSSTWAGPVSFSTPYCATNFPVGVEPITLVDFGDIENVTSASTEEAAQEYFLGMTTDLGQTYSYTITAEGNTNGTFTNYFTVFFDWNQDGEFNNEDERFEIGSIYNSTGEDGQQASAVITVPEDALVGETRMRVAKKFNTSVTDACNTSGYGQAEDYTVNVVEVSCLNPSELVIENITTTTADVSWTSNGDETEWEIIYGVAGFDPETEGNSIVDNDELGETISDLTPEMEYDIYIRAVCGDDDQSQWVGPESFMTPPTCPKPINLMVDSLTFTSADVSWEAGDLEDEWFVIYGEAGFDPETDGETAYVTGTPAETLTSLTPETDYEFYVVAICSVLDTSSLEGPMAFTTDYCESIPTSNDGTGFTTLELQSTVFTSGGDITYEDFTDAPVEVTQGTMVSFEVDLNTGFGYDYNYNVWVDYNDNLEFEESELVVSGETVGNADETFDASFILPEDTMIGNHRLRLAVADSGQSTPNPCYSGSYGDTADFTINVIEPCEVPTEVTIENITDTTADVSWTSNGYEMEWEVIYGETGFDPASGGESIMDNNEELGVILNDLTPETTYDVYVRAICNETTTSEWTVVEMFTTLQEPCETPTDVIIDNVTDTTAEVTWTDNAGVNEWEVLYGETGFDPTSGGESMMDNNEELGVVLSDLTPETTYDVYVRAICDTDNMSEWTAVEMFTTLQEPCDAPTDVVIDNVTDSTAEVTWTDNAGVNEWEVLYGETGFDPLNGGESMMDNDGVLGVTLIGLDAETTYDVYVRAICDTENMSEWTAVESFTTTGLSVDSKNFEGFNYYPNPVKNSINLESRLNIDKVSIYNLLGQQVLSRDLNEMSPSLDMSNLASGAYILRVQIGSQSKIIRVIKE